MCSKLPQNGPIKKCATQRTSSFRCWLASHIHALCVLSALSAIVIVPALCAQRPAAPTGYIISGIVVNHGSNEPLGGVGVMLTSTQQAGEARHPRVSLSVITSADGRFSFTNLPPGKYALMAQRGNAQIETYQNYQGFFTGVVVGHDADTTHIVFPLQSPGRLAGTVLDDSGEPVTQATVVLFHKDVVNGKQEIAQAGQTNTSASGAFHFAHLAAGTYFVAVNARPWYAESVPSGQSIPPEFDVAYPVTYYGETSDPNAATPIQLPEGGSANLQIALHAVAAVHVSVSDRAETETQDGRGFSAMVYAEGPGGARIPINAIMTSNMSQMELTGLAPGHYFVDVQVFKKPGEEGGEHLRAEADLVPGTTLTPAQSSPISISGHVSNETGPVPEGAMIILLGKETYYAQVEKDGAFSFNQQNAISPGNYEIALGNAPHLYVKSVSGTTPAQDGTIRLADGAKLDLPIVVSQSTARIRGFAVREDKLVSAAMVLLLPLDFKHSALVRRDQSDSDGSFLLPEIIPGRYYLLAIDDGRDLAYLDSAAIKPYLPGAVTVDVTSSTDASLKVNVLHRQ